MLLLAVQKNEIRTPLKLYEISRLVHTKLKSQAFFNYPFMQEILPNFCIFHINAPGQEHGAAKLPEEFGYPSMEDLAEQVSAYL